MELAQLAVEYKDNGVVAFDWPAVSMDFRRLITPTRSHMRKHNLAVTVHAVKETGRGQFAMRFTPVARTGWVTPQG